MTQRSRLNRRDFLTTTAAGLAIPLTAPAILKSAAPNERIRLASIGVGGKGWSDLNGAAAFCDVVAFCDVDTDISRRGGFAKAAEKWPNARRYSDWRELFDKEAGKIDAVTVSTPDHMHAPVTMTALQLGIATYTQKPLTRTIHEARALTKAAEDAGVSTQMGNQNHSGSGYRTLADWVQKGILGKVKVAHTWSNRPVWPQGLDRPQGSDPVPENLDWDAWLGVAPERPYKKGVYHPFKWRGWYDFGAGALGDMGCHIIDPVVWSLELGPALSVQYDGPTPNAETFPKEETIRYRFGGTRHTAEDTLEMTWYDGGRLPSIEGSHLPAGTKLPSNGVLMIGEDRTLLCPHGGMPQVYPPAPVQLIHEPGLNHYEEWTKGIKTGSTPNSSFAYAGPLTETVLLGVVASRVGSKELKWDAEKLEFTNSEKANSYVKQEYREGWEVEGL